MSDARHDGCTFADDAAAYLLGALPEDDVRAFEAHLATCEHCQLTVAELGTVVDMLPSSSPPVVAPPALKGRIMAVVNAEAELLAATGAGADRPLEPRRGGAWREQFSGRFRPAWLLGATALACAGIVIGIAVGGSGSRTPKAQTAVARIVLPGNAGTTATARLVTSGGRGRLELTRFPAPSADHVYEVWLHRTGQPAQATDALFSPRGNGSASVDVPGDLSGIDEVLVTPEPLGGSDTPTSAPIVVAPVPRPA